MNSTSPLKSVAAKYQAEQDAIDLKKEQTATRQRAEDAADLDKPLALTDITAAYKSLKESIYDTTTVMKQLKVPMSYAARKAVESVSPHERADILNTMGKLHDEIITEVAGKGLTTRGPIRWNVTIDAIVDTG